MGQTNDAFHEIITICQAINGELIEFNATNKVLTISKRFENEIIYSLHQRHKNLSESSFYMDLTGFSVQKPNIPETLHNHMLMGIKIEVKDE